MKKILKIFFVSLILIFLISLTYLSIFGIETNRFNKLISDKIRNIHPEIEVKLKKIKFLLKDKGLTINGAKKFLLNESSFNLDENSNNNINTSKTNLKSKLEKISSLLKEIKKIG